MEWGKSKCGKYSIQSLSADTIPGALKVMKEGYIPDEILCMETELNKNPAASEQLLELCADAALDGVSLVVVEISTGKIVGAAFNRLQVPKTGSGEKTLLDNVVEGRSKHASVIQAWISFLSDFDKQCNYLERYGVDCGLEILFLATLKEHRRNKLGFLLIIYSIDLCRKLKNGPVSDITISDLGPKYAYMKPRQLTLKVPKICYGTTTAVGSQRVATALGVSVLRLPFSGYVYEGKTYSVKNRSELYCEGFVYIL